MGEEALKKRLEEIEMGELDYALYTRLLESVKPEVESLRRVLSAAQAKQRERIWHRGTEGELDDTRLVDAIAGESVVFKRREPPKPRAGEVPNSPKRISFLFDCSASMYRFNGMDQRLLRSIEAVVMVMEGLYGFESKFEYEVAAHDGDNAALTMVPFGKPPVDEAERLKVVQKMLSRAQYCGSGDHTLEALDKASAAS